MPKITPHDLRHTCAVVRLSHFRDAGLGEHEALERLRAFFGWSHTSQMPRHYARAYFESKLSEVWRDDFDAHISAIRNLASKRED